jgi:hypothetical protein
VPGSEPGKRVTGAGTHTESGKEKEEGEVHHKSNPITALRAWLDFEFKIVFFRVKKWQQLRILKKKINVVTFTMTDLQHECGCTTETPMIYDQCL